MSCEKVSDPVIIECAQALNNGGAIKFDGLPLKISKAILGINEWTGIDRYYFQVEGIHDDCIELERIDFTIEIPTGSDFDGSYDITNDFYSVFYDNSTNYQHSFIEVKSGTMTVNKVADREYEVDMTGNLVGGGTVAVSFQSEF